jgi:hypothetical protein
MLRKLLAAPCDAGIVGVVRGIAGLYALIGVCSSGRPAEILS